MNTSQKNFMVPLAFVGMMFFAIGFAVAAIPQLTLIGLGVVGFSLALIYLKLKESSSSNGSANTGDPLGDIINDY